MVDIIEYNVERDSSAQNEMVRKTGGSRGIPVLDIEGIILRGFSPGAIDNAVRQRQQM